MSFTCGETYCNLYLYNLGSVSVKQSAVLNICVLSIVYSRSHDPGRVHNGPIKGTNTRVTPLRSQLSQLSCAQGRDIHQVDWQRTRSQSRSSIHVR